MGVTAKPQTRADTRHAYSKNSPKQQTHSKNKPNTLPQHRMSSRAVKKFRAQHPGQHIMLTKMTTLAVQERQGRLQERVRPYQVKMAQEMAARDQEDVSSCRRKTSKSKKSVTWSRSLLQIRSISPRVPQTPAVPSTSNSPPPTAIILHNPMPFRWQAPQPQKERGEMEPRMEVKQEESISQESIEQGGRGAWRSLPLSRLRLDLSMTRPAPGNTEDS